MYNVKKMFFSAEQQRQQEHFIHISITGFVKLISNLTRRIFNYNLN